MFYAMITRILYNQLSIKRQTHIHIYMGDFPQPHQKSALVKIQILEQSGQVLPKQLHLWLSGIITLRFGSAQI